MKYELLIIIPAKYSETELPGVIEGVVKHVKSFGIELLSQEDKGKQKLAYPVRDLRFGQVLVLKIEAEPAVAKKLNTELRLKPEIARHMLAKIIVRKNAPKRTPRETKPQTAELVPALAAEPSETKEEKMTLEDLDRKLDEILGKDIA